MFILNKSVTIDGYSNDDHILAFALTKEELREKWNNHVIETDMSDRLPSFNEDKFECFQSYSGGGCYAVHEYEIIPWVNKF